MKFNPRQPRDDVNVSKEHPLVEAGTLILGLGLILATVLVSLIFLVDVALYFVPAEKEVAMFDSWLPSDLVTVRYDDPRLHEMESLVSRLARNWPESAYRFRVEIDDSSDVNAMAFPGGLIVVSRGLLDDVASENELAFIIGHEFGHFRNRDHIRSLGRGVVLGILFTAISSSEGSATLATSIADLTLRGFSRRQESAADRFGLEIVQQEYGHVADSWRFFERVDQGGETFGDVVNYVSTHPSPKNRVRSMIEYADEKGWSTSGEVTGIRW